jgi:hypothetical protein
MILLSEHQITFFLSEYFDDHVLNMSSDALLNARLLRTLQNVSEPGVLLKVIERERVLDTIEVLGDFENALPDQNCIRLLDYVDIVN